MAIPFDKIDSQFRLLTDLLFFTDRVDVDWSNYYRLLQSNGDHYIYFWDRLRKGIDISWDEAFWFHRFDLMISWRSDRIERFFLTNVESNFYSSARKNLSLDSSSTEYIQFLALCKVKAKHKVSLMHARNILFNFSARLKVRNLLDILNDFIPPVFSSLHEYGDVCSKQAIKFSTPFVHLEKLEKQGIPVNYQVCFKVAEDLFFKRSFNRKNRSILFNMICHDEARAIIKTAYQPEHRNRLMELITQCEFNEFDSVYYSNIKYILDIDASVADELIISYADKLQARGYGYKKTNIGRIIKVLKTFPQFSPRKMLVYLSNNNKMSDIKFLIKAFPELKKLAIFV